MVEPLAAAMPEMVGIARDFAASGRHAAQPMIDRLSGALTMLAGRAVMAERAGARASAGASVPAAGAVRG